MKLLQRNLSSLANMSLRASSLAFRFVLSFYIIKYLGLEAAGIYGLALGAIGIAPALTNLGLNYFHQRELVGQPPSFSAPRMKTRLVASTVTTAILMVIALIVALAIGFPLSPIHLIIAGLVWLEVYANDLHLSLVALEMPLQANTLVFIRLASWVPFVIVLGLLVPETRSIEFVLLGWLVSYVLFFALLFWFVRSWPLAEAMRAPLQIQWLKERIRIAWFIFISDMGLVGFIYVDRYIVSFMLGLELTGLYTFYWSLANALQTLVGTAIIQVAMPTLYKAYNTGVVANWRKAMRQQLGKVLSYALVLGACIFVACELLIHYMGMGHLAEHRGVFIMLLLSSAIRSVSDLMNIGLMSVRKDTQYAAINLAAVFISAGVTFAATGLMGFEGVGVAALLAALIVTSIKAGILLRFAYRSGGGRTATPSGTGEG
ncbi:hypothetical protein K9U40_14725 [Xanthobacter autotrophicus]|uniref:lipopolysaccharide biosynthesis protein n=1 Tax=Xanthobacter TaxID=279 RepID=UPI0024AAD69D|nr:hypothetical protein [Xanthobacter autotrophicus]MDI4665567.1 hypothetical protein [Xanthobacter autotrophicus]